MLLCDLANWLKLSEGKPVQTTYSFAMLRQSINEYKVNVQSFAEVRMMSQIFSQAERVCIWLGEAADNSGTVMDFFADTAEFVSSSAVGQSIYGPGGAIMVWLAEHEVQTKNLASIFSRPYWSRLWVVQEFLLSKDSILLCGNRFIEITKVLYISRFLNSRLIVTPLTGSRIKDKEASWSASRLFGPAHKMLYDKHSSEFEARKADSNGILGEILMNYSNLDCKDPRDKVYGLVGLVRPSEKQMIDIDYSKAPAMVFWEALATSEIGTWVLSAGDAIRKLAADMDVVGDEWKQVSPQALERYRDIFGEHDPRIKFANPQVSSQNFAGLNPRRSYNFSDVILHCPSSSYLRVPVIAYDDDWGNDRGTRW